MDRRFKQYVLPIAVGAIVVCGVLYFTMQTRRPGCTGNGGSDVFACLVTSAHSEYDPRAPVGTDCYWNKRALEDKTFAQKATGQALTFKFQIYNYCSAEMVVKMELGALQPGGVQFSRCDGVFVSPRTAQPNQPVTKNCTTQRAFSQGTQEFKRAFVFSAGVDEANLKAWDPEIAVRDAQ